MATKLMTLFAVPVAAMAGNAIGAILRTQLTGRPAFGLRSEVVTAEGTTYKNFPVATKFYPALLAAAVGKPRWLFAFLGGLLAGVAVDDRFEEKLFGWITDRIVTVTNTARSRGTVVEEARE